MVKVKRTITLELESSGQRITIDMQEAKDIIKSLAKFVNSTKLDVFRRGGKAAVVAKKPRKKTRKTHRTKSSRKGPSMSETKRQEIIDHISKQISARPKTLSALLKGVSFVPNYLPAIRQMVESRGNIAREIIGKRVYYSRKSSAMSSQKQTRANAA